MNIAENILKHSLKDVYFLTGTPCGGKTTLSRELAKKHGFIHFNDNWHEESFKVWQSIIDEKYQKAASKREAETDWEAYFSKSVEEFLAEKPCKSSTFEYDEYLEFAVVELIKLSQTKKVVADVSFPMDLLVQIADYHQIACMLAPAELVIRDYYDREDHKEFIECIRSLKNPEKKLATQNELFRLSVEETFAEVEKYQPFHLIRTAESTVEERLSLLEKHFKL